jgi:rubredoxin
MPDDGDDEGQARPYEQGAGPGHADASQDAGFRKAALKKEIRMDKYRCTVCGYIYDPAKGDSGGGIPAGTPFEKLPDDWVCPECGVGKDMFEKI